MSNFKDKMHKIVCHLGLRPTHRWRSLQRSQTHSCILWPTSKEGEEGREGEGRGKKRESGRKEKEREGRAFPLFSFYNLTTE